MRLLMIAAGYLPYLFSENLCNAKLVYALKEAGITVDVISKTDEGPVYDDQWHEPWSELKSNTHLIQYAVGNKIQRLCDVIYSGVMMDYNFSPGIRWIRRAYKQALQLMQQHKYDAVLTRSPSDLPHLVGYKLKKKTGIKWIANWNDPADAIWPEPYTHQYSLSLQRRKEKYASKMLQNADYITFPSKSLKDHFNSYFPFLNKKQIEIIPHIGLVESTFKKVKKDRSDNKLLMCHSGNLSKERNPELMFAALKNISDQGFTQFEFHIMGHINDYTQQLIKQYHLEKYVKSIGSYPYLSALEKIQEYDILVLLEAQMSKGIFFASKFTDYAQTRLPILAISPTNGFANDMISIYHSGILADNSNIQTIQDAIEQVIQLWKNKRLDTLSSYDMYQMFAPARVVSQYIKMTTEK